VVWALVFGPADHLNAGLALGLIPEDEPMLGELPECLVYVEVVIGTDLDFELGRTIQQPPVPISMQPEPGEQ
jgi:hypothetical protein